MASVGSISVIPEGFDPVDYDLSNFITFKERNKIAMLVRNRGYFVDLIEKSTRSGPVNFMRVWKPSKDCIPFLPSMIGKTESDFNSRTPCQLTICAAWDPKKIRD